MIYFVQDKDGGDIKIGTSTDVASRLDSLRWEHKLDLVVLAVHEGGRLEEKELHARFAHLRTRGEWFRDTEELRGYISDHGRDWLDRIVFHSTKIADDVFWDAKLICAYRKEKLSEFLSDLLRPILSDLKDQILMEKSQQHHNRTSEFGLNISSSSSPGPSST